MTISNIITYFTPLYLHVLPLSVFVTTIIGISDGIDTYSKMKYTINSKYRNPLTFIICSIGGGMCGFAVGIVFPLVIPLSSGIYLYNKYMY